MNLLDLFGPLLIITTLLCALVAGFVWGFAVVVMPGIAKLQDQEFLRAFKLMDGIIQQNQPLFLLVWVGSIFAVVASLLVGLAALTGTDRMLLLIASLIYLFGVQFPTIRFNIPLNNRVQELDLEKLAVDELRSARSDFEPNWNRWNNFRTWVSCVSVVIFMILLLQM